MIINKIYIISIILIIAKATNCHADKQPASDLQEIVVSYPDCNVDSTGKALDSGLRFRLPVLDTIIHNDRIMHLMQEMRKQLIFLLHGHDLHQFFISREKTNLTLIGRLDDSMWETQHLDAQLISWRSYLLLVIAFERNLIIYEINADILVKRKQEVTNGNNATVPFFEPIQQLTMPGVYRKMFLVEPVEDKILLILAVDETEFNGRIKTYEWINTYFDPIEELMMPTINAVNQLQNNLIVGRTIRHASETILSIYEILPSSMKLVMRQTLTVQSKNPHFVAFREKHYLIACSKDHINCIVYKNIDGQYVFFRQRSSKDLAFNHFIAGKHFLVGSRDNEVVVVPNARLNCYSSFSSKDGDVSSMMTHINEQRENFILLNYVRPSQTLLRIVEIEEKSGENLETRSADDDDEEELKPNPKYQIFEETIGRLRSILLQHNAAMDVFRKISNVFAPKFKTIKVQYPVTVKAGNIGIVKIVGKNLRSPVQLIKRISDLGQRFGNVQRARRFANEKSDAETTKKPTRLKAQRLRVKHLVYNRNIVEGFHLDAAAKPLPILSIRPLIKTKVLNTQELMLPRRYPSARQASLSLFDFVQPSPTMRTRQLNVTSINNIPWTEFYDSLFLKNRDKLIEGRLVMQAATKINSLRTPLLNGLVVKNLFNLVQQQVVHSDLVLAHFNVSDLQADTVNGLDFANDVVFSGRDTFIKSPVVMHDMNISGDFLLDNDTKLERSFNDRSEDLKHVYTGKIVINGTLTLNNLLLEDIARIFVNGESLAPQHLKQRYLLHKTKQEFIAPLIFGNALVTTPDLITTYLNDHPTEKHLLKNTGQTNPNDTLLIIFMSAEIQNDLICNEYTSHLANISREAVRHGEVANITGFKNFEGALSINHLMTLELNDLPVHEMVLKSQLNKPLTLKGPKFFEKIQVRNETNIELQLEVNNLNSLPLRELLNYDFHLDNLTLPHELLATNVVFHKINGISFDKIFMNLKVSADENLVLHKDLIIEGNAQFSENLEVDMVNNVEWTRYQQSLVRLHEHAVIGGQKRFLSELVITKALNTPTLNNLSIEEIFSNVLSRSKPQIITGSYTFDQLEVSNMDVTVINDMPTASFIDTRSQEIEIESDIVVPKVSVHGNIQGDLRSELNLSTLEKRLEELPAKQWRNVHVLGNARWNKSRLGGNFDNMHKLAYLQENAVTRTGNHVISGNVKLRRPIISQMVTKTAFPKDIDFDYIARDCLLKEGTSEQIITAPKSFQKPLNMQSLEAAAVVGCNKINNIDVLRLNASLYRLSSGEPLIGPIHFMKPPIVGHLAVQGTTNGLSSEHIYHEPNQRVPPIKIAQLYIDKKLELSDINDMNFDYFLQNRVTKEGPALEIFGFLTFENLVLNKDILLQSINGIPIDSLILKTSDSLQALTGAKTIEGDLILAGPAHVLRLNGEELIDSYQKSIFKHLNYHFDELSIDEATFERGLLPNPDEVVLLAAPLTESQSRLALKYTQRKRLNAIERELASIDSIISVDNSLSNKSRHLIYLDYDLEAQILWQPANETIDKSYSFERQRLSMCERQRLLVQMTSNNKRLFLSNATSSLLHDSLRGWHVKLENFCSSNAGKARSKITLTSANFTKSFDLKKIIENVKIFQPVGNQTHLILHAIDLLGKRNEVRLLKISPNKVEDLQSITEGIGKVLKLFQLTQNHSLLISSALSENYPTLSIYAYSAVKERFELAQVIDGDYDIIELVQLSAERYHLILSCVHCQRISVFEFNVNSAAQQRYRIYQFIKLNQLIDKLVPFTAGDGSHYLLLLSEHGQDFYHLYKFSHIQGWLHFTYGYFNNIQLAVPLVAEGSQLGAGENSLLLLCGSNNDCGLVKACIQQ